MVGSYGLMSLKSNAKVLNLTPMATNAVVAGDLNSDGIFNSLDFGLLRMHMLAIRLMSCFMIPVDVDNNDSINSLDFAYFRLRLLGFIKEFPIEKSSYSVTMYNPEFDDPIQVTQWQVSIYLSKGWSTSRIYVTKDQLNQFGWYNTSDAFVRKLNDALIAYGITDENSIALFMATMAAESDYGRASIEEGDDAYFATKDYMKNRRGAGYIQITYKETHQSFLNSMNDSFSGADTATYISNNYAFEASAWYWSKMNKTGEKNLNAYVKKYGSGLGVFLITQFFVHGYPTEDTRFDTDLRLIRDGGSFKINKDASGKSVSLSINGHTWKFNEYFNWDKRQSAYNKAVNSFK